MFGDGERSFSVGGERFLYQLVIFLRVVLYIRLNTKRMIQGDQLNMAVFYGTLEKVPCTVYTVQCTRVQ